MAIETYILKPNVFPSHLKSGTETNSNNTDDTYTYIDRDGSYQYWYIKGENSNVFQEVNNAFASGGRLVAARLHFKYFANSGIAYKDSSDFSIKFTIAPHGDGGSSNSSNILFHNFSESSSIITTNYNVPTELLQYWQYENNNRKPPQHWRGNGMIAEGNGIDNGQNQEIKFYLPKISAGTFGNTTKNYYNLNRPNIYELWLEMDWEIGSHLYAGPTAASKVYVGNTEASAIYIGNTRI